MVKTLLYTAVCVPVLAFGQIDSVQSGQDVSTRTDSTVLVVPADSEQIDQPHEARMDGREVVTTRRAVPGNVRVIGRDQLSRSFQLSDVLGREPGVLVRSFGGGLGNYSILSLRGAPSQQVEVYVDGIPMGGSSGTSVDVGPYALDGLERVEIRQAGTEGSDGAPRLDLVSRRGWARWGGAARAGSFGERAGSAWWGSPGGAVSTSAWYETARNDYSFPWNNGTEYNKSDDYERKLSNNDFTGLGAAVAIRPLESVEASGRWSSTDRGVVSLYLPGSRARWSRKDWTGRLTYRREGEWESSAEASWRRGTSAWTDSNRTSGYLADRRSEETLDDANLMFSLARKSMGWFDPRGSAFGRWEASERSSLGSQNVGVTPNGTRGTVGAGVGWSGRDGDMFGAELGARWSGQFDRRDFTKGLGGVVSSTIEDKNWLSGKSDARIWMGMAPGVSGWISGAWQRRSPDFGEWMGSSGGVLPSLDLVPETALHGEVGMEGKSGWLKWDACVWNAHYSDPIRAESQGGSSLVVYRNGPDMLAYGMDAKLFLCAGPASLSLASTLQNASIANPNPALDGNVPKRTPAAKLSAELQLGAWHGFSTGMTFDLQSATWASDLNTKDDYRSSWGMYGFWARWHQGAAGISFQAKNLGDVRLPDQEDMPLQGRQFMVRMDLDFSAKTTELGRTE